MPGVAESAVIGVPHADFGEGVVAVVVPKDGATLDAATLMQAALKARIANFKVPKRVHIVDRSCRATPWARCRRTCCAKPIRRCSVVMPGRSTQTGHFFPRSPTPFQNDSRTRQHPNPRTQETRRGKRAVPTLQQEETI